MRKTLLLLAIAMLLPVAVSAQLLSTSSFKMQHDPFALKSFNTRLTTPLRADLADNQMIMGHYDTDEYAENGLGITGLPGSFPSPPSSHPMNWHCSWAERS